MRVFAAAVCMISVALVAQAHGPWPTPDASAESLCSGTTTYLDGEGNCDSLNSATQTVEQVLYGADNSGTAASETSLTTTFGVMNLNLAERGELPVSMFTTTANQVCNGSSDSFYANVTVHLAFNKTTGSGNSELEMAIGEDTTGAIGNGDEVGAIWQHTVSDAGNAYMGSMSVLLTLSPADCFSVLGRVQTGTAGVTVISSSIAIDAVLITLLG